MDSVSGGIFLVALYKALELFWEKAFGAAWEPVGEALKDQFTMLAGKDKATQRWEAFQKAHESARSLTVRQAPDREGTERVFQVLDGLLALAQDPKVDEWVRSAAYDSLKRLVGAVV